MGVYIHFQGHTAVYACFILREKNPSMIFWVLIRSSTFLAVIGRNFHVQESKLVLSCVLSIPEMT